jgi:hypothetical protein
MCPACAATYPLDERFCARCGMPLVYTGTEPAPGPATERRERARKIRPQYAQGELVGIARGRNQAEAELIQGLLLEEGVPSMLRRSRGFDVPDYLAAGPRDVLVPASGAATAREVLLQAELRPSQGASGVDSPARLLVGLLVAVAVVAVVLWLGTELIG